MLDTYLGLKTLGLDFIILAGIVFFILILKGL